MFFINIVKVCFDININLTRLIFLNKASYFNRNNDLCDYNFVQGFYFIVETIITMSAMCIAICCSENCNAFFNFSKHVL